MDSLLHPENTRGLAEALEESRPPGLALAADTRASRQPGLGVAGLSGSAAQGRPQGVGLAQGGIGSRGKRAWPDSATVRPSHGAPAQPPHPASHARLLAEASPLLALQPNSRLPRWGLRSRPFSSRAGRMSPAPLDLCLGERAGWGPGQGGRAGRLPPQVTPAEAHQRGQPCSPRSRAQAPA